MGCLDIWLNIIPGVCVLGGGGLFLEEINI